MPRRKRSELTAGIFVVASVVIGLGVVVWLGSSSLFHSPAQQAAFVVSTERGPVGLAVGDSVVVNDYVIGKIVDIVSAGGNGSKAKPETRPVGTRPVSTSNPASRSAEVASVADGTIYLADISDPKWLLRSDAKAYAEQAAIGSSKLVITSPGTAGKPLADREHPIVLAQGGIMGSLAAMSQKLDAELDAKNKEALLGKIHVMLDSLQELAADAAKVGAALALETDAQKANSLLAKVHSGMADLQALAVHLNVETDRLKQASLMAKIHQTADDVGKTATQLAAIVTDARPKVERSLTAVTETAEQIRQYTKKDIADILLNIRQLGTDVLKVSKDMTDVSSSIREVVMLNKDNLDEMIDNLTQVSVNLKAASSEIRRKPWRLLYTPDDKEMHSQNIYDAAAAFSGGASQLDQAITKLVALRKAHPEGLPADNAELAKIRKQLEETFARFTKAEQALWKELAK